MRKYPLILIRLSIVLLAISFIVLVIFRMRAAGNWASYLMFIHLALILLGGYEIWLINRLKSSGFIHSFKLIFRLPKKLFVTFIVILLVVMPTLLQAPLNFGVTKDGTAVYEKLWFEESGKYYLKLNRMQSVEITKGQYRDAQNRLYEIFACFWILFSYVELVLSYYIVMREVDQPV